MTHQIVVNSMHERKVEMAKRSGAFIGLPGGFGTFEEVNIYRSAVPILALTERVHCSDPGSRHLEPT